MYHLTVTNKGMYNIFSDKDLDTTGGYMSIAECFRHLALIGTRPNAYRDVTNFMDLTNFKTLLCSFGYNTIDELKREYPEFFI